MKFQYINFYGLTQDPITKEYIFVIDEYLNERYEKYGECPIYNKYYTYHLWCQSCDPKLLTEGWTSGNETLDELIKSTQLKAIKYNNSKHFQWIPYNDLTNIE